MITGGSSVCRSCREQAIRILDPVCSELLLFLACIHVPLRLTAWVASGASGKVGPGRSGQEGVLPEAGRTANPVQTTCISWVKMGSYGDAADGGKPLWQMERFPGAGHTFPAHLFVTRHRFHCGHLPLRPDQRGYPDLSIPRTDRGRGTRYPGIGKRGRHRRAGPPMASRSSGSTPRSRRRRKCPYPAHGKYS